MLRLISSSSSSMTRRTASLRFLLDNIWPWRSWYLFRVSRMSVKYSFYSVAIYALPHDASGLFLPHSNTLETLKQFVTSHITSFFASFCFLVTHSDLYSSIGINSLSSTEQFCDKGSLKIVRFYLFSFVEQLCDKVLLTMLCFDLFLFVEQFCDNFSFTILRFDSPSFVTLTFEDR